MRLSGRWDAQVTCAISESAFDLAANPVTACAMSPSRALAFFRSTQTRQCLPPAVRVRDGSAGSDTFARGDQDRSKRVNGVARLRSADDGPPGQADLFDALHKVAVAAERLLEPFELARIVAARARPLLGADGVVLFVWDDAADGLRSLYTSNRRRRTPRAAIKPGSDAAGEAFQRGEPVLVDDDLIGADAGARATAYDVRAALAVPWRVAARRIGALSVYFCEPHAWSPDELHGISLLAEEVAPSIESARLAATALRSQQRVRGLGEAARALAVAAAEAHVLELAVHQAAGLLNAFYVRVWLDDDTGGLRSVAAEGRVHARTRQRRLAPDSVSGLAARGSALNLVDAPAHSAWRVTRDFGDRTGLRAYVGAAISRQGGSLGVLEVMRPAHQPSTRRRSSC